MGPIIWLNRLATFVRLQVSLSASHQALAIFNNQRYNLMIQYVEDEYNRKRRGQDLRVQVWPTKGGLHAKFLRLRSFPGKRERVRIREKGDRKKNGASSNYQEKANDKRGVWRLPHFLRLPLTWASLIAHCIPPIPELPMRTRAALPVAWLQPAEHCNIVECDKWGEVSLSQTTFSLVNSVGNIKSDRITRASTIKKKMRKNFSKMCLTKMCSRVTWRLDWRLARDRVTVIIRTDWLVKCQEKFWWIKLQRWKPFIWPSHYQDLAFL